MAREKGIFHIAANYEAHKAAPLDARQLVKFKADLIQPDTWVVDGTAWVYNGMMVAVANEAQPADNGVYVLTDASAYTSMSSWQKLADISNIQNLQEQINNIEVPEGNASIDVDEEIDLPKIGAPNVTYYVKETQDILRWDDKAGQYVSYKSGGVTDLNINIIYGGDSNGNTEYR